LQIFHFAGLVLV